MTTEERYLTKFDEINALVELSYQSGDRKKIHDDILGILIEAYYLGVLLACEQLHRPPRKPDPDEMYEVIYMMIDGETFEDRINKHLDQGSEGMLKTLAESEYHRVFNTAAEKTAMALTKGIGTKTWKTMNDWRVRDTHEYIEGLTVPIDGVFVTYDGDYARFPGDFQLAENNCGCRCTLIYRDGNMEES